MYILYAYCISFRMYMHIVYYAYTKFNKVCTLYMHIARKKVCIICKLCILYINIHTNRTCYKVFSELFANYHFSKWSNKDAVPNESMPWMQCPIQNRRHWVLIQSLCIT